MFVGEMPFFQSIFCLYAVKKPFKARILLKTPELLE